MSSVPHSTVLCPLDPHFEMMCPCLLIGTSGRVGCLRGSSAGKQISLLCCAHMRLTVTWHWLHISASVINEYRKCSSSKQWITGLTNSGITWQLKKGEGDDGMKCIYALRKTVLLSKNDCHFVGESVWYQVTLHLSLGGVWMCILNRYEQNTNLCLLNAVAPSPGIWAFKGSNLSLQGWPAGEKANKKIQVWSNFLNEILGISVKWKMTTTVVKIYV